MNSGGKISGNKADYSGGGVEVSQGGTLIMNSGSEISGNTKNGGVEVILSSTFIMNGGTISGNTDYGVKIDSGTFKMSGDARVGGYSGGVFDDNTIFLKSGQMITISSDLSSSFSADNPAGTIDLANYPVGGTTIAVLSGTALGANNTKFKMKDDSWSIDNTGKLEVSGTPVFINVPGTPPGGIINSDTASSTSTSNPIVADDDGYKGVFTQGRRVSLTPFVMAETETTYKLWRAVYNWAIGHGYTFANAGKAGKLGQTASSGNKLPKDLVYGNHPVTNVSWRDCVIWCNAYTEMTMGEAQCVYRMTNTSGPVIKAAPGQTSWAQIDSASAASNKKGYRLPTEAEWEWAARYQGSDSTNAVSYGSNTWLTKLNFASGATADYNTSGATDAVAWYGGNSSIGGEKQTHKVKGKLKNSLDLYDMNGNVWEWCFDWYNANATSGDGGVTLGTEITDPVGASSGTEKIWKGGYWEDGADVCVVGKRHNNQPYDKYDTLGFRIVYRP